MGNITGSHYIFKCLLFSGLLMGAGVVLTSLKTVPLLFALAFAVLLIISFFIKLFKLALPLFMVLLSTLLFINFMLITEGVAGMLYPDKGWIEIDGEKHPVMDMSWVAGVLVSTLLTPLVVWLYHYKSNRNVMLEMMCTLVFVCIILAVLLIF